MQMQTRFLSLLKEMFIGEEIQGDGAYINLMKFKAKYFNDKIKNNLENLIFELYPSKEAKEEVYDKLYNFFHTYFDKSGGIMFANTPKWKNIYTKLNNNDVDLFYKTKNLFYIKTEKILNSLKITIDDFIFDFKVEDLGQKIANEKKEIEYYFVNCSAKNTLSFKVKYKEKQNYEVLKSLLNIQTPDKIKKYLYEKIKNNENIENEYIKIIKNSVFENLSSINEFDILITNKNTDSLYKKVEIEFVLKDYNNIKPLFPALTEEIFKKAIKIYNKQIELDYFIHNNSEKFLKEQFNLYLYNYLNEDEIFNENRLKELQKLKKVSFSLIEDISLFEEELKKIWLKPRFVKNSNYVITKDNLQKYNQLENFINHKNINSQIQEWKSLNLVNDDFDISKIYENKYSYLPFDTKFFKDIEIDLLEKIDNLDNTLDGIIIHSENFQALNSIKNKYKNEIDFIFIDPPYNTGNDGFLYKDSYKHSSWLSMMDNRLSLAKTLLQNNGIIFSSIDDNEMAYLKILMDDIFGAHNFVNNFMWLHGKGKKDKHSRTLQQYNICYSKDKSTLQEWKILKSADYNYTNPDNDPKGAWFSGSISFSEERSNPNHKNYYEITSPSGKKWKRQWQCSYDEMMNHIKNGDIYWGMAPDYSNVPRLKIRPNSKDAIIPTNILDDVGTTKSAENELINLFGQKIFSYPKPTELVKYLIQLTSNNIILDFFGGSGTTIDAVIRANKEDNSKRKFICVEMGEYFDTIILPRIKKLCVSLNYKNAKPKDYNGNSLFFKYYSLEQYEDILKQAQYKNSISSSPLLGLKTMKLTSKNVIYDFKNLYEKVDLAETISNLLGEKIIKITKNKIILQTREIDLNNLSFENYPELKPLIYWGDSDA